MDHPEEGSHLGSVKLHSWLMICTTPRGIVVHSHLCIAVCDLVKSIYKQFRGASHQYHWGSYNMGWCSNGIKFVFSSLQLKAETFFINLLIKRKRAKFNQWVIYQCKGNHLGYQSRLFIKCSDNFQLFQKFAANMTMSNVPADILPLPLLFFLALGMGFGGNRGIELSMCSEIRNSQTSCLLSHVLDIFKLIMVTIFFFQSSYLFHTNNYELRQKMSTYINIMRWDYSPTNPNDICVLYASATESREGNDKSF